MAVFQLSAAGGALWSFPAQEVGTTPLITTHGVGTVHYGEDMPVCYLCLSLSLCVSLCVYLCLSVAVSVSVSASVSPSLFYSILLSML